MAVSGNAKLLSLPPLSVHPLSSHRPAFHLLPASSEARCPGRRLSLLPFMKTRAASSNLHCLAVANGATDGFIHNAAAMNFFERLSLAWRILFPTAAARRRSAASIAKHRLKMILFSDRCAVSDEAKQKIVGKIMAALSDFVEIDSQDMIQLSVSADTELGTVYSVTVPVRRVKPGYGEDDEYRGITAVEYFDTGDESGSVDVKFEFFVPGEINSLDL